MRFSTYSAWNAGLLTVLIEQLQGNDGGKFWSLVDAYYASVWASEYESRKTDFGGFYYMIDRSFTASEYRSYTGFLREFPAFKR